MIKAIFRPAAALAGVMLLFGCQQHDDSHQTADHTEQEPAAATSPAKTEPGLLASGIDQSGFDTSVRPQDDFFEYANGGWVARTEIPADKARWGPFMSLNEKAQEDIRNLVEEVSSLDNVESGGAAQKIRDYYNSYMDTAKATELGVEAIREDLERIAAAETTQDLFRLFGELSTENVNTPLGVFIFSDFKDANTNVVYISENGLTLPDRDYYLLDDERYVTGRALYRSYVETLFGNAGIENAGEIAEKLLALETQLAEAHWTREENRDRGKQYNPHSADELDALAPKIQWQTYLEAGELPQRDVYIVMQPSYFEAISEIISEAGIESWKDYLTFQLMNRYASVLGDEYFKAWFAMFPGGLQGVEEAEPQWKRAVSSLSNNMGELLGQLYVEKHFKPESKARMETMIDNLVKAYRQSISELEWMGDETKQRALIKLSKFKSKIGYPDQWRDYSKLEVVDGDVVANIKNATAFEYRRNLDKLDKPVDKSEWLITPQTVNAGYLPMWNEIMFPAAILQPPFFDPEADDAVNYGAIGAGIGHEIGHGFDDQGRTFDGDGNLNDWWTEEDNEHFLERKEKLAAQYNAYEVIDGLTINGEFTSGENIGDLGGVAIAYKAYHMSLDGQEPPVIDGLTGDQRFFLGQAQVWRSKARPEEAKRLLTIDPHSPAKFRVNGVAVNIPEFYEAFDVKEGDGMYLPPEERVKIW
jgi:predicted metalloendopeptidase